MILIRIQTELTDSDYNKLTYSLSQDFDLKDYPWVPLSFDCGSYLSIETTKDLLDKKFPHISFELEEIIKDDHF
jgi:predicted nucleic acid-binding protein